MYEYEKTYILVIIIPLNKEIYFHGPSEGEGAIFLVTVGI